MNEPGPVARDGSELTRPVFISYATADRKEALSVCKAIERRGTQCWISTRDVAPGENYQEAIVRSLRNARAMVLVFSDAANNSDEIKKELSLASRYHIPVMALSANALPRDIAKGLQAGFFRYLTKPIRVAEFMDTLDVALKFAKTNTRRSVEEGKHGD